MAAGAREPDEVLHAVRTAVRALLLETSAFAQVPPEERRALANKLVHVGLMAARLAEQDERLTREAARRSGPPMAPTGDAPAIARAQSASDQLGMRAVQQAGATVRNLRDSIAFPEFVQSLITGTFQAILSSSTVQLGSLGELLDNVAASAEEFDSTIQDGEVRRWALARFGFLTVGEEMLVMRDPERDVHEYDAQLAAALSASEDEVGGIDGSDIEGTLLPLVRRKIGRDKQGILATLVQMGLQRIVVDEGRLEASMDLRVDAESASQQNQQALDTLGVTAGASANMILGPVGATAYASTSIGRVRSDVQQTNEQIAARAGLRSSVQLAFRTEQVPLDRMASANARVRISQNARVPDVAQGSILTQMQPVGPARLAAPIPSAPPPAPRPPAPTPPAPTPPAPTPPAPTPPAPTPPAPTARTPPPPAPTAPPQGTARPPQASPGGNVSAPNQPQQQQPQVPIPEAPAPPPFLTLQ